jgi:hypothetical protein
VVLWLLGFDCTLYQINALNHVGRIQKKALGKAKDQLHGFFINCQKRVKLWVLRTRQKPKGTSSMPHPAESEDRSCAIRVAGSDLTDYANPPRLFSQIIRGVLGVAGVH